MGKTKKASILCDGLGHGKKHVVVPCTQMRIHRKSRPSRTRQSKQEVEPRYIFLLLRYFIRQTIMMSRGTKSNLEPQWHLTASQLVFPFGRSSEQSYTILQYVLLFIINDSQYIEQKAFLNSCFFLQILPF